MSATGGSPGMRAAVLAGDGGNSKVELLLAAADGRILAFRRGATISHEQVGLEAGIDRLRTLALDAARDAGIDATGPGGLPIADIGAFCLAGADFPSEVRMLRSAIEATGLTGATLVRNDAFAALRAGAGRGWGVALICGEGVNGVAVGPTGRTAGFAAVLGFAGDWGSGPTIGRAALAAAIRAVDGRGPRTTLSRSVAARFGRSNPLTLVRDLTIGGLDEARLSELAPLVFGAATDGDAVARGIVDRVADELTTMTRALVRRTGITRRRPEIVLAGGVFRNTDPGFHARLAAGIEAVAPGARLVKLTLPPVVGAALLGLDALGLSPSAAAAAASRLRAEGATLEARRQVGPKPPAEALPGRRPPRRPPRRPARP